MKRHLLIAEFLSTPWALQPERLAAFAGVLSRWASGTQATAETLEAIAADKEAREARKQSAQRATAGGIAVLPFYGVVTQRGNMVDDISGPGSVSTQRFTQAFRELLADDSIGAIVIDIDSPGGSVYGVQELAAEILQARSQKQIVAVANSLAASAAYWVGSAASEFYVTPGGEVGSIGVWQAHEDWSKFLDEMGVKTTFISAGKYKVEGNAYQPLDAEAQAFMQQRVDEYYTAFTKGVAKGRGVGIAQVRDGMGQGRVLGADQALAENMVDGIATLDDVIKKVRGQMRQSTKQQQASVLSQKQRELQILG